MSAFEGSTTADAGRTGLSRQIRTSGTSEAYDLGGYGESQAKDLIRDAFGQPIPASEPLRFTFVIGGGKAQNRHRYDTDLGRYLTAALRELGYREDRAASTLLECQGSYKSQHDTHKGIRTLQVFPRIEEVSNANGGHGEGEESEALRLARKLSSPEYMAAVCNLDTFQEMVQEKVWSWSQKRRLLRHLGSFVERHKKAEQKLTRVQALSTDEQDMYDNIDPDVMEQKSTWLTSMVKAMVENGQLTKDEREQVLCQVQMKLEALSKENEVATAKQNSAKLARIQKQEEQLTKRQEMVRRHVPVSHKVKHQDELRSITAKLIKIDKLENIRGRLLTIDEVKQIGAKAELEERATILENDSRGWFEEDHELSARLNEVRKQGQRLAAKMAGSGAKGGKTVAGRGKGRSGGGGMAMDSDGWSSIKR
ncbi:unnamed protein product [Ascophyllum nodosum]